MIVCGYQGVGKSTYCRNNPNTTVDLDSSMFKKTPGWEKTYIDTALNYGDKTVFISAHENVIDYLYKNNIQFTICAPAMSHDAWRARLEFRYFKNPIIPNLNAIRDFDMNFDKDMALYKEYERKGVDVKWITATVVTDIGEALNGNQ